MRIPRALCHACIGALLVATVAPAMAQDRDDDLVVTSHRIPNFNQTLAVRVNYSDLDTSTYAGRQELRARVYNSAEDVCRLLRGSDTLYTQYTQCRDEAYQDAMSRVGTRYSHDIPSDAVWLHRR